MYNVDAQRHAAADSGIEPRRRRHVRWSKNYPLSCAPPIFPQRKSSSRPLTTWSIGKPERMFLLSGGGITNHVPFPDENGFPPFPQNHLMPKRGSPSQSSATIAHRSSRFLNTTACGPDRCALGESILRIFESSSISKFCPVFFI